MEGCKDLEEVKMKITELREEKKKSLQNRFRRYPTIEPGISSLIIREQSHLIYGRNRMVTLKT